MSYVSFAAVDPVEEGLDWLLSWPEPCACCHEDDDEPVVPKPAVSPASDEVPWATPGVTGLDAERSDVLPAPSEALLALELALDDVERLDPTDQSRPQALADLLTLVRLQHRGRMLLQPRLADAVTRSLHDTRSGRMSLSRLLQDTDPDVQLADLTLAKHLRAWPLLREAVQAGTVTLGSARRTVAALRRSARHLDSPDGLIDGQASGPVVEAVVGNVVELIARARVGLTDDDPLLVLLLDQVEAINRDQETETGKVEAAFTLLAEHLHDRQLRDALAQQLDALLPSELEARAEAAHQERGISFEPALDGSGGRIVIDADVELYEQIFLCLAAEARRDPDNPADTKGWTQERLDDPGGPTSAEPARPRVNPLSGVTADSRFDPVTDDLPGTLGDSSRLDPVRSPRNARQRRHDALRLLLQRYLAAGLAGSHDKAPVAMHVTLSSSLLDGQTTSDVRRDAFGAAPSGTPGALPALAAGARPVPASVVRRWWCDATVTGYVLSQGLIPLGHTHTSRTLTAAERKALNLQGGPRCAGLGCCNADDPLTSLEPHHVQAWAATGHTALGETIWVCPTLHHDIHHGRTRTLRNGRSLNDHGWTHPEGWEL
jgi:hypothetical protein